MSRSGNQLNELVYYRGMESLRDGKLGIVRLRMYT
jgi:hypothetical protein